MSRRREHGTGSIRRTARGWVGSVPPSLGRARIKGRTRREVDRNLRLLIAELRARARRQKLRREGGRPPPPGAVRRLSQHDAAWLWRLADTLADAHRDEAGLLWVEDEFARNIASELRTIVVRTCGGKPAELSPSST